MKKKTLRQAAQDVLEWAVQQGYSTPRGGHDAPCWARLKDAVERDRKAEARLKVVVQVRGGIAELYANKRMPYTLIDHDEDVNEEYEAAPLSGMEK